MTEDQADRFIKRFTKMDTNTLMSLCLILDSIDEILQAELKRRDKSKHS